MPPKIREKIFFQAIIMKNLGIFRAKIIQNWGILLIFRANIIKLGYFDNFSGKNRVKFWHFDIFFIHIFPAKMSCPTKVY